LVQVVVPQGETCESFCRKNVLCTVFQVLDDDAHTCYQGELNKGAWCLEREGDSTFKPLEAKRLMHGDMRVLANLTGVQVMGLKNVFTAYYYIHDSDAVRTCAHVCYSNIACQYWQYSKAWGCWVENPAPDGVGLIANPITSISWMTETSFAKTVTAGEHIQHFCPGYMGTTPHLGNSVGYQTPEPELFQGTMTANGLEYNSLSGGDQVDLARNYAQAIAAMCRVPLSSVMDANKAPNRVSIGPTDSGTKADFFIMVPAGATTDKIQHCLSTLTLQISVTGNGSSSMFPHLQPGHMGAAAPTELPAMNSLTPVAAASRDSIVVVQEATTPPPADAPKSAYHQIEMFLTVNCLDLNALNEDESLRMAYIGALKAALSAGSGLPENVATVALSPESNNVVKVNSAFNLPPGDGSLANAAADKMKNAIHDGSMERSTVDAVKGVSNIESVYTCDKAVGPKVKRISEPIVSLGAVNVATTPLFVNNEPEHMGSNDKIGMPWWGIMIAIGVGVGCVSLILTMLFTSGGTAPRDEKKRSRSRAAAPQAPELSPMTEDMSAISEPLEDSSLIEKGSSVGMFPFSQQPSPTASSVPGMKQPMLPMPHLDLLTPAAAQGAFNVLPPPAPLIQVGSIAMSGRDVQFGMPGMPPPMSSVGPQTVMLPTTGVPMTTYQAVHPTALVVSAPTAAPGFNVSSVGGYGNEYAIMDPMHQELSSPGSQRSVSVPMFEAIDRNHDGVISRSEWTAAMMSEPGSMPTTTIAQPFAPPVASYQQGMVYTQPALSMPGVMTATFNVA
jgi:hypothetical protein